MTTITDDDEHRLKKWLAFLAEEPANVTPVSQKDLRTILALLDRPRSKRERMRAAMDACIMEMKRIRDEEDRDGR